MSLTLGRDVGKTLFSSELLGALELRARNLQSEKQPKGRSIYIDDHHVPARWVLQQEGQEEVAQRL